MRTEHTPGPWKTGICQVTKDFLKGRLTEAVVTLNDEVICITGEGDANARLIAAAPELLEALQALVRGVFDGPDDSDAAMLITKARAAITKATGETL